MVESEKKPEIVKKNSVSDGKNVKEQAITQKAKKVKELGNNSGRNANGTFKQGNQCSVGNNGGRPQTDFSHRAMAKARAKKDPARILKDLDELDSILDSDSASPMEKMKAIEIKIKLNGGFDPVENKDVTEHVAPNPFENLTEEELRKLAEIK